MNFEKIEKELETVENELIQPILERENQRIKNCKNRMEKIAMYQQWHTLQKIEIEKALQVFRSRMGKQDFSAWKKYLQNVVSEYNCLIDPSWRYFGDLFLRDKDVKIRTELQQPLATMLRTMEYFKVVFPKASIYLGVFGSLVKDTRIFKKRQRVQLYAHRNNWWCNNNIRFGCIGFNRKSKKYEIHTIRLKNLNKIHFKLVGLASPDAIERFGCNISTTPIPDYVLQS